LGRALVADVAFLGDAPDVPGQSGGALRLRGEAAERLRDYLAGRMAPGASAPPSAPPDRA
jgi:hypothetical protein